MPRQARLHFPGSLHHVMARGIHGQDIFLDKKDYDHFFNRLEEVFSNSDHSCFAWALLNNHLHLLIKSGDLPLSSLMRRLLTGHAVYFNRRHKRSGHLFQNRFKSILCQEDSYFLQLVRYIHLNPIRTGAVKTLKTLNRYQYSGHAYILGEHTNDWQDIDYPLQWFGKQKRKTREKYLAYVKEGISEGKRDDLTGGGLLRTAGGWKGLKELKQKGESTLGDTRILGDGPFVEEVLKDTDPTHPQDSSPKDSYTLDQLTTDVCDHLELSPAAVKSSTKQRDVKRAKAMICYIAVRILKIKGIDVAHHLTISKSSVSKLVTGFYPDDIYTAFMKKTMTL